MSKLLSRSSARLSSAKVIGINVIMMMHMWI
jgi:hypothetical protein